MAAFATVQDVITLFRALTTEEMEKTEKLLPLISDALRQEARKVGRDLDGMLLDDWDGSYASTVKLVTVDIVSRALRQNTKEEPLSQESQSALGYTWSGTYAIPGGGNAAAIMRNDLKRLGLMRQKLGVIDLFPDDRSVCPCRNRVG